AKEASGGAAGGSRIGPRKKKKAPGDPARGLVSPARLELRRQGPPAGAHRHRHGGRERTTPGHRYARRGGRPMHGREYRSHDCRLSRKRCSLLVPTDHRRGETMRSKCLGIVLAGGLALALPSPAGAAPQRGYDYYVVGNPADVVTPTS